MDKVRIVKMVERELKAESQSLSWPVSVYSRVGIEVIAQDGDVGEILLTSTAQPYIFIPRSDHIHLSSLST